MKVWSGEFIQSAKDWIELRTQCFSALNNHSQVLQRNVNLQDNIQCQIVDVEFLSNASIRIEHGLRVVPIGFWVININHANIVFQASSPDWTKTAIYLACNTTIGNPVEVTIAIIGG